MLTKIVPFYLQLLQKAGWQEGTGLGVSEQGRTQPVAAWVQSGRSGIGSAPQQPPQSSKPPPHGKPKQKQTTSVQSGPQSQPETSRQSDTAGTLSEKAKPVKRAWRQVSVEEPLDVKVKRVRQAQKAEQDDKEGKEIQRLLYRAFRESEAPAVTENSPLLRSHHRLRSRNPLL